MANLTLDYGVGTYVHMLEEYSSLETTDKRRKELKRKLKVLGYNPSIIKYLEAMTNNCCFDIDNKNIGKVKIKK